MKKLITLFGVILLISSCGFGHYHNLNLVRPDKNPVIAKKSIERKKIDNKVITTESIAKNTNEEIIESEIKSNTEVIEKQVIVQEKSNSVIAQNTLKSQKKELEIIFANSKSVKTLKKELSNLIADNKSNTLANNESKSPLGGIGWVLIILGLIFLLLINIGLGLLLMLVGLLFVVAGK